MTMDRWTWHDTAIVCVALIVLGGLAALIAQPVPPPPVRLNTLQLDTIGCGHVARCTPITRPRWMSDNPFFAAPGSTETR
jgi:hypothetical protein